MWKEILTYNSSVLVLNVEINDHLVVHLSNFKYELDSNSFVAIRQKKQILQSLTTHNGTNRIFCLGCKVILDHHCGLFLPYLIAQDSKQCYLFCLDANTQWLMRYNFTIPKVLEKHIELCATNYSIENGPTLIWTVRDEIFIYKAEYSLDLKKHDILRVPIDLNCDRGLEAVSNILWWKSGDSEQGMIAVKDSKGTIVNSYLITIDNEERKANIKLNRQIIPFPYLQVITSCVLVHPEHLSANETDSNSYTVFISTTQSQLLEFSHGCFIKHINIPFSSCQNIQIFESPKSECDLILLCFEEDKVCAVDWINSKILRIFQVFSHVLLDDFIGSGTFQILLLPSLKDESHQIFDKFILTDFCKIDMEKSKENKKDNEFSGSTDVDRQSVESCVDNVVNALMKKVQTTEVSVTECKMEKSEKMSFVKRHCETLSDLLVNVKTSPVLLQNSGLAQLVTGQESISKELSVQLSKIIVRSKWQEIASFEWIIGVEIENVGQRAVSDISLCAVNKTRGILVSSSRIRSEIRKQQVLSPGQRATLLAIISIPRFSFENHFTVSLMLTWKHEENNEYLSQFSGQMTLHVDDIINISRRICQHVALYPLKTQVVVSIASCDINNVMELLKSNMNTCEHSSSSQEYHLKYSLAPTLVSWTCAKKSLVMDIFTRDYNELCWCLRLLRQQLPDNLTWSLFGDKLALEFAIVSIKNEIRCRIDKLYNCLKARTVVRSVGTEDSLQVEEMEEISVKRRKISQYKHSVDNYSHQTVDLIRKNFLDNCSYSCNTDNAVLTLLFHQNKSE